MKYTHQGVVLRQTRRRDGNQRKQHPSLHAASRPRWEAFKRIRNNEMTEQGCPTPASRLGYPPAWHVLSLSLQFLNLMKILTSKRRSYQATTVPQLACQRNAKLQADTQSDEKLRQTRVRVIASRFRLQETTEKIRRRRDVLPVSESTNSSRKMRTRRKPLANALGEKNADKQKRVCTLVVRTEEESTR